MKEVPPEPERQELLTRLQTLPDASTILLAVSLLSHSLKEIILRFSRPGLTKDDQEGLFNEDKGGPLHTFSSRIRLAYALDCIGPRTRDDLNTIRYIRNLLAHASREVSFETDPIPELCLGMWLYKGGKAQPSDFVDGKPPIKDMFGLGAWLLAYRIDNHSPWKYEPMEVSLAPTMPLTTLYRRTGGAVAAGPRKGIVTAENVVTISSRPP